MTGAGALLAACDRAVLYGVVHVPLYSYAAPGYKMPLGTIALLAARASAHSFAPRVTLFAGGSAYVPYGTCPHLTLTGINAFFGSAGPSASVRYGFALRGFCRLCLPRTHRVLRSLLPPQAALTPYSTGGGCYRFPQTATEVVGTEVFQTLRC